MVKTHSKLKSTTGKAPTPQLTERFYTIGYTPNLGKPNPYSQLLIKGRWLEQLGFTTGQAVTITTKKGQLIIELAKQLADIKRSQFFRLGSFI